MHVLIFDVESNGLYGKPIAVAAIYAELYDYKPPVIIDHMSAVLAEVLADNRRLDPWAEEHVVPGIKHLPFVETQKELLDAWFEFYNQYSDVDEVQIWVDCGYPVETNFLNLVFKDRPGFMFKGPYPLMDACNFFHPDEKRECSEDYLGADHWLDDVDVMGVTVNTFIKDMPEQERIDHNPLWDCICSLALVDKATDKLFRIGEID